MTAVAEYPSAWIGFGHLFVAVVIGILICLSCAPTAMHVFRQWVAHREELRRVGRIRIERHINSVRRDPSPTPRKRHAA